MSQLKEAIEDLEKAERCIRPPSSFCEKAHGFLVQALILLRTAPEQPPAGEFTKEIQKTGLMEYPSKKHAIIKLKEACDRLDTETQRADKAEARYEDITGGMMKKQIELIQEIATSQASRKELLEACEGLMKFASKDIPKGMIIPERFLDELKAVTWPIEASIEKANKQGD